MSTSPAAAARARAPRAGFTLIELLIVVVIIGILAAIAIPKFAQTKAIAAKGTMKSDLRNLAVAQESYFSLRGRYTDDLDSLGFRGSTGVDLQVEQAGEKGWSATARRVGLATSECGLFYGDAAPVAPASAQSVISCIR